MREFKVTMKPINGGDETKKVDVRSHSAPLASAEANRMYPDWIAVATRCVRVLNKRHFGKCPECPEAGVIDLKKHVCPAHE